MTEAINAARVARGVAALAADESLVGAARGHSVDLAAHPELVDEGRPHDGSDGSTIAQRIADWGWQGQVAGPVDFWLNSPRHVGRVLGR